MKEAIICWFMSLWINGISRLLVAVKRQCNLQIILYFQTYFQQFNYFTTKANETHQLLNPSDDIIFYNLHKNTLNIRMAHHSPVCTKFSSINYFFLYCCCLPSRLWRVTAISISDTVIKRFPLVYMHIMQAIN